MATIPQKLIRRASVHLPLPWVVLAIGMLASLALFFVIRDVVEDVAEQRFQRQASDVKGRIEQRIQFYADVLFGLKALFASEGIVSRLQFHRFVESLDLKQRYPSFDLVNFAAYVTADERDRFVDAIRRDDSLKPGGYPDFSIKPPGKRPEYHVVVYVEPMTGFEFAFGLDLGANPAVRGAAPQDLASLQHLARDSGNLTASGRPIRVKTSKMEYTGLAMRLAVYRGTLPVDTVEQRRRAYIGSVGAGFNVENLMEGALTQELAQLIRFTVYDVGSAGTEVAPISSREEWLLFDSQRTAKERSPKSPTEDAGAVFTSVLPLEVASRIWEIRFSAPKAEIVETVDSILPWIILAGGLLSSALLFGMTSSLASSRRRAMELANEITRDLRDSEASLAEAQQIAHIGNWSLDPAKWTMTWSAEVFRIFGLPPQSMPERYDDFIMNRIHEHDRDALDSALRHTIEARQDCDIEHRMLYHDNSVRWAHTIVKAARMDPVASVSGTIMDITERKLAQQEIIESQAMLNEGQKLAHLGSWQWDISSGQMVWSDELYRIYGTDARRYRPSIGNQLEWVHPDDREMVESAIGGAAKSGMGFTFEGRIVRSDGEVRRLLCHGEVLTDDAARPAKVLGACLDITEQKHAEEALQSSALQLQALSRRLVEIQELDRLQFSRELHDRVGQNLTALSINLDILRTALPRDASGELRARLDDSAALLEATTGAIENVMSDMRPPMLDDYGLLPALEWYTSEFARRTGIVVRVHGDEGMERLPPTAEIALFRIMQEALNNVAKHAQAGNVDISLSRAETQGLMSVTDDGVGFNSAVVAISRRRARLGMVTMRERTQAFGGQFDVQAAPDRGTRIVVRIPL